MRIFWYLYIIVEILMYKINILKSKKINFCNIIVVKEKIYRREDNFLGERLFEVCLRKC